MKKLLAMILALGVTFSICTSCGSSSSDTEDEDSSSTVLENSDELLKSNNKVAKGICVVKIADSVITMACYSNSEISQCAGIYPNPKTEAPSFGISNIPEEYKQVPSYDDDDEDAGVMD